MKENITFMDNPEKIKNNKILIINLGGIGDMLLSTPALRALKNKFSEAEISMLIARRSYEIAKDLPYIDKIFIFHKRNSPISFLRNIATLFILRKAHFDLAINMRTLVSRRSALAIKVIMGIINPKIRVGRDTEGRGYFFNIKIPEADIGEKYEMEYDIDTVKALGAQVIDRNIDFKIDRVNQEAVEIILKEEGVNRDDIVVGIHPGGEPSRQWPIENFSRVIKKIKGKIDCKFVITGTGRETKIINRLIKMSDIKLINMAGRISVKELAALINRLHLYIANDTGPMHIAAALRRPLVAIFGPGCVTRFDPRNISDRAIVLYKKVDCSPCNRMFCNSRKCLTIISPEEVAAAALGLLESK